MGIVDSVFADRRCKAVASNKHRCLLVTDHEGQHCTVGGTDEGWFWWDDEPSPTPVPLEEP
jgi:hypothetical protein